MGRVFIKVRVFNPHDLDKFREVELLVDSGSIYTVIPRKILESIGVKPDGRERIRIFGGKTVVRDTGIVYIEYNGKKRGTTVIFGERRDSPIIGVPLLEMLCLQIDPINKKVKPIDGKEI